MESARPAAQRHLVAAAKILISGLLIWAVASQIDAEAFAANWRRLDPLIVLAFLALAALQTTLVAGTRLKLLLGALGTQRPLRQTSSIELSGFFFEQVAFGFVGGDAMRLWLLHRSGTTLRTGFKALLIDRVLGFGALLLLVALGLPDLLELLPALQERVSRAFVWIAIAAAAGTGLLAVLLVPKRYWTHPVLAELRELAAVSLRDASVRVRFLLAFALATTTHLLNVLIFFLIARNLGLPISLDQWFCIVPAALLFSMIPVSAGGWGLREGIFVVGLGTLGIAASEATVLSVLFGLGILLVTLPGGILWLLNRRSATAP
jgi:uncharacterized membrane protein YbhN (UPF0104 family)